MRIAAYNLENLFDRPRAFDDDQPADRHDALKQYAKLNGLFEKTSYSGTNKQEMLRLMDLLGILNENKGPYVLLRKIRGRIIRRPRDRTKAREIVANGRVDWVGWCELRTAAIRDTAIMNTGRVIRDMNADILAVVEAESRPVLQEMNRLILPQVGADRYPNVMIIDGNDQRGIDVGIMTKAGYPIGVMRSHVHDMKPDGHPIFSRDCPEYEVTTPSGDVVWVIPNHFKSKYGGNDAASQEKRRAQAQRTAEIYQRLRDEGYKYITVLGDLNDTPDSIPLSPLLSTDLKDASDHENFSKVEFRANNGHQGIGTYGLGNDSNKIDYLLLSPALYDRMQNGGIFRKGAWPGSSPRRWGVYPELNEKRDAASDHHAIYADIDV
ncbi:MAG: endonuclease/exonuclease/phosphatase family protein [Deltaproteobacteria bacterium]|nr:endonuclease/exonuclease/phosphatase family protein [Deltaproteobacteria bacterium]